MGPPSSRSFTISIKTTAPPTSLTRPRSTRNMPVCRDRASMAYYLTRNSVKLSYIAELVHQICNKNGRKVIVFCDWPSTAWLVEILLMVLGFNVISIRAKHRLKDREAAIAQFNDKTCPVQVLVTSVKVSATSVNLQKDCADTIFADVRSRMTKWSSRSAAKIWVEFIGREYKPHDEHVRFFTESSCSYYLRL
ncbi:hypothetical protein HO173_006204 [Letharia columbiana]|uniref:Helicase C-terminal domain-containing protein n=1 Tax=Letharia columbiana TaxID=112416 RepID=A0A8H6L4S9_9LECA|nr:uncharacterized protein HO173_006204 [Letharia columbiana]KAF6235521.1 hypothetical protein HO173_006204 [Letharia columbiana]